MFISIPDITAYIDKLDEDGYGDAIGLVTINFSVADYSPDVTGSKIVIDDINDNIFATIYSGVSGTEKVNVNFGLRRNGGSGRFYSRVVAIIDGEEQAGGGGNGTNFTVNYVYKSNTSPTTPSSITVPSTLKENVAATISWGASTDSDGNLSGYILEQQLNGGSWSQIYKGSKRSKSITPQASWNTVAYRVKAYDSQNVMSSYKTSATRTVQHNSAPSMPEWCSVPNPVKGGTSIKITWPASTDPDNNLAGYILERKFNSNSWTQIYKGANRSYTDPIPLDKYKTVTYRVKAYDTKNAQSTYATSATRTIQNSTVLQFRLKTPIESTKRAAYGQEIMTYTIPSGATFKAEACNNGFDKNPTWEDVTEFVKKQKIFEFANKSKTASKWGYDIRVTVDRNGATGNCYFTRGNGFFEEEGYAPSQPSIIT